MIPFVLADHSLISAVPFLVPALIIIGFLAFHVIRDRRAGDDGEPEVYDDDWGGPTTEAPGGSDDHASRDAVDPPADGPSVAGDDVAAASRDDS